ncbi:MAG TPA: hypothetical protein VGK90_04430 [Rhizomicrobium sp.]|jgi:hypothetical protein
MARFPQSPGARGSLKWIQTAVNVRPASLAKGILPHIKSAANINWLSPLADDEYAEYRDDAFLERIGCMQLGSSLRQFWPSRGPQWDALGQTEKGDILLVEAKAHIGELCSPPTQAKGNARDQIYAALGKTAKACNATPRAAWTDLFYQFGNRLAHLYFLRQEGIPAWLVLVNFVGDVDMQGPVCKREWIAAYHVVQHAMGLGERNPLSKYMIHIYPSIAEFGGN